MEKTMSENQDVIQNDNDPVVDDLILEDEVRSALTTTIAQKKHFREKFQRESQRAKALEEELNKFKNTPPAKEADEEIRSKVEKLSVAEEKRTFGYHNGLSPEETDEVFAYASGAGIKPTEAKDKPFVKAAIDSIRAQRRAEGAVPDPSSDSIRVDGKSFAEMNDTERKQNMSKVLDKFKKR